MNWTYFWLLLGMIVTSTVVAFGGQIVATDYLRKPDEERSNCGRLEVVLVQILSYVFYLLVMTILVGAIVFVVHTKADRLKPQRAPEPAPEVFSILEPNDHDELPAVLANEDSRR